jgi:hypothetical protein
VGLKSYAFSKASSISCAKSRTEILRKLYVQTVPRAVVKSYAFGQHPVTVPLALSASSARSLQALRLRNPHHLQHVQAYRPDVNPGEHQSQFLKTVGKYL